MPPVPMTTDDYESLFQCHSENVQPLLLTESHYGDVMAIRINDFIPAFDILDRHLNQTPPYPILKTQANALETPMPCEWGYFIEQQLYEIIKQFSQRYKDSWTARYWERTLNQWPYVTYNRATLYNRTEAVTKSHTFLPHCDAIGGWVCQLWRCTLPAELSHTAFYKILGSFSCHDSLEVTWRKLEAEGYLSPPPTWWQTSGLPGKEDQIQQYSTLANNRNTLIIYPTSLYHSPWYSKSLTQCRSLIQWFLEPHAFFSNEVIRSLSDIKI